VLTLAAIPLTCWLCLLLISPRRPLPGNDVAEQVYANLLGRRHRVALLALVLTAVVFAAMVIALPQRPEPGTYHVSDANQFCADEPATPPICYIMRAPGVWVVQQLQANGSWLTEDIIASPPPERSQPFIP
jgi:hypothetical protein